MNQPSVLSIMTPTVRRAIKREARAMTPNRRRRFFHILRFFRDFDASLKEVGYRLKIEKLAA